jgi:23S rRNA (cytidine2498-2'-O)-methyltransferase
MFFYCLPNPGFENRLKAEAAAHAPDLHPSFSRPGFVTFKATKPRPAPRFTFSRISGRFLAKGTAEAADRAIAAEGKGRSVHRFSLVDGKGAGTEAAEGTEVLDVVQLGADEFWWGVRTVDPWGWGVPGGIPDLTLPEAAPSRAWLKLEEMVQWSRWEIPAGTVALELGSAPGGASWALLNRGVTVIGVDVAPMAAVCTDHPRYSHRALSVRDLRKKDLPDRIDALFCDLGLKPVEAVPQIRHLCQIVPSITRLYYTLKLGEGLTIAELDQWRDAFRKLGFTVRSTHLPSNRMEILVAGVRTPGGSGPLSETP